MRLFAAGIAFLVAALFYAWLFIGLGLWVYWFGFAGVIRRLGNWIDWGDIGTTAAIFFAGTLFLCIGLSLLAKSKRPLA